MIKVLNIITGGLRREGITSSQLVYAKYLDKNVFSIDVLAVHNNDESVIKQFEELGCKVIKTPDRLHNFFRYRIFLDRLIKNNRYDVVHVHGSSSLMWIELSIAKRNKVATRIAHSRNTVCSNRFLNNLLYPAFSKCYNLALACGKDAGSFVFRKKDFLILHNGKNLESFLYRADERNSVRSQLGFSKNEFIMGFVGKLNNQKNLFFLFEVFSSLSKKGIDCSLLIVGDGPLKSELEKYAKNKGLRNVIFLGSVSNVEKIIQAVDLMCLPSFYEGLPNVVVEWQASGLRCLVSDSITRECSVSDDVVFLPIDRGVEPWCSQIISDIKSDYFMNREERSRNNFILLKHEGFDIADSVEKLSNIYSKRL